MSAPSSPRPLSWTARVAVCLPLMALALVVGPAEASQPADGTAGNAAGRSPAGQSPDDGNRGRDCDANPGAGDGNPAFGACTPAPDGDGSDDVGSGKDVVLDLDEGGDEDADVVGGGTVGDDPAGGTEDTGIEGAGVGGTGTESTGTEGTGTEGTGGGTGETGGGETGTGETGGGATGTGPGQDIVTGGTPSDVVTSGSGPDEVGISWIVISRPIVEIVATGNELPMSNPVAESGVTAAVLERPATPPVLERPATPPVLERPATTPVQPVVQAPGTERALPAPLPAGSSTQLGSAPGSRAQSSTPTAAVPAALPFTGFGTGSVVLLGSGLALIGLVLTLAGRTRTH